MNPRGMKDFIDVDVAEASYYSLVEQDALDVSPFGRHRF